MIGFVIPFKSKFKSKNWRVECLLLEHTIQSLLNQSSQNFACYVVYTDYPEISLQNARVKWIAFPFDFVRLHQMIDKETFVKKHNLTDVAEGYLDQGKRVLYGCKFAKKDGCRYIMSLDADDLVSNRMVKYLDSFISSAGVGWYVDKGYIYIQGNRFCLKVPKNMNQINGSVNIVRSDLIPEPDFAKNCFEVFNFFPSHAYLKNRIWQLYGEPLKPIPFYAVIYVVHDFNWMYDKKESVKISAKNLLRRLTRSKYVGRQVKEEFGIYNLQ